MPALVIRRASVRSFRTSSLEIYWEIESTHRDVLDFSFRVLYSEAPDGPFEAVSPELEDTFRFVDDRIQEGLWLRRHFYRIRVTEKSNGRTRDFGPYELAPEPDLNAREMRRHRELLYREFSGRRCWLLPRRTFGQRCGCWSEALQQKTRSGCVTCFDTGFVRGYMTPIESYFQFEPLIEAKPAPTRTRFEAPCYPQVKPGDLIIEPENLRWRVVTVTGPQHGRSTIFQIIEVHRVDATCAEYQIPFDPGRDIHKMGESPERNLTNPQTLGAVLPDAAVRSLYSRACKNNARE